MGILSTVGKAAAVASSTLLLGCYVYDQSTGRFFSSLIPGQTESDHVESADDTEELALLPGVKSSTVPAFRTLEPTEPVALPEPSPNAFLAMDVEVGTTRMLTTEKAIVRVDVDPPGIVTTEIPSPHQVRITAIQPGDAKVILLQDTKKTRTVHVRVDPVYSPGLVPQVSELASTDENAVRMTVNTSRIVTEESPITHAEVNIPDIVRVNPLSPTQLQLSALRPGRVEITIRSEDRLSRTINVTVVGDAQELERLLRSQFPWAALRVTPTATGAIITGLANDESVRNRVIEIAENYYPQVIDQITVGVREPLQSPVPSQP